MQTLGIKSFGPIEDIKLEIDDVLLFIGTQASGKSTISKAIFFFKSLRDDFLGHVHRAYNEGNFDDRITDFAQSATLKFLSFYGPVRHYAGMELKYVFSERFDVTVANEESGYTVVRFSRAFVQEFRRVIQEAQEIYSEANRRRSATLPSSQDLSEIKAIENSFFERITLLANKWFQDDRDLLFIPAGRSLITTLSSNLDVPFRKASLAYTGTVYGIKESDIDAVPQVDYLTQGFIERIKTIRPRFERGLTGLIADRKIYNGLTKKAEERLEFAHKIIQDILKGDYRFEYGVEKIYHGNGENHTQVNYSSSGQQETLWILLLIFLLILNNRKVFMVIEEPEAHLFPVGQKQIVDLIALLCNADQNQIILTTHSPYILSSFNNLLYASILGKKQFNTINNIVPSSLWIKPKRVSAYMVEGGHLRSIIDQESQLIQSAEIDSASHIIIDTFDQLFELDNE